VVPTFPAPGDPKFSYDHAPFELGTRQHPIPNIGRYRDSGVRKLKRGASVYNFPRQLGRSRSKPIGEINASRQRLVGLYAGKARLRLVLRKHTLELRMLVRQVINKCGRTPLISAFHTSA
jgi:hypothetical protein